MSAADFDVDLESLSRRRSYKWRAYPPDVLPAFLAEMDFPLAPCVAAALHGAIEAGDTGYASPFELAESFAGFARWRHGWEVDPARVFLVPDVMAGVDQVLSGSTEPGDGVVINTPVYPPFFHHVRHAGRRVVEAPLRRTPAGWELDLAVIDDAFSAGARAYLLCNPHNPTGRVLTRDELDAIAALADRYCVAVVADEIHAPLTLPGARHTPYVSLGDDAAANAVTLTSTSKAFNLPGLKCAIAVAGSEVVRRRLATMPEAVDFSAGLLGVIAAVAAWRDGGPWLGELLAYLDTNRRRMADLVARHLPGVAYVPPEAGYLAWLDCAGLGLGDEPATAFLERGRVAVGRGTDFGGPGAGFARVTMGTSAAILEQVVQRMAAALL